MKLMAGEPGTECDVEHLLAGSSFFRGLPERDCRELAKRCRLRHFGRRDYIFMEESPGSAMYLLTAGNVQLIKTDVEGCEVVVRTLKSGDVFAEVVLQTDSVYPVSAVTVSEVDVLELQRADIFSLLDNRDFRDDFISFLMKKQRYLAERVRYLASYDVEERLYQFLHEQHGRNTVISTKLSKKDIAAAIGATPETLSRLIQRLRDEIGLVWEKGVLTLPAGFWEDRAGL